MGVVLVVEDHEPLRKLLVRVLERGEHVVLEASDGQEALERLAENEVDVVVSDIRMPRMDGMELLRQVRRRDQTTQVILITAYGDVPQAVEAMKQGAYDFLEKEAEGRVNIAQLRARVEAAIDKRRILLENLNLKSQLSRRFSFPNIIGKSPKILEVLDVVKQVAPTKATVLITGESGTGKELIANALHYNSPRAKGPFIKVNCAALPETLLESELFGHEKGAFTGAYQTRIGRFEAANGGTLFLDEIGNMSPAVQVKLLRVLQEREFERVGGTKTIKVDVRLITATNTDLEAAVREGRFREDLYWRVKVVHIHLPPLRERREDIPLLVLHFIKKYAAENSRPVTSISDEALQALLNYDFPGNVRELENIVESAVVLCRGDTITKDLLPASVRNATKKTESLTIPLGLPFEEIERRVIEATLAYTKGNKTKAARVLRIGKRTLFRKLKKYGLSSAKGEES